MSLINLLNDDIVWEEFLNHKRKSSHLPDKIIKNYEDFINNKKYKQIAQKIIDDEYIFSIPKKIIISKMNKSKKRIVYMYNEEETYILKLMSFLLYKYDYLFYDNLYSFRVNSGVRKAIYNLKKNNLNKMYGYKVDIKNYFNSIQTNLLLPDLKKELKDEKLYNLFYNLLTNNLVNYKDDVFEEDKGIMAGVPISSFLANFYLKDLDKYFYENNIVYFRYADDIIIFDKSFDNIKKYQKYIKEYLNNKNLSINEEKEFFYKPGDKFDFLGFSYQNGIIDLSNNSIRKIKGKIKRSSKGLRRWMIRKNASGSCTLKAMNRKFNRKFYGKEENVLTWKYWFFPLINTTTSLKEIDKYMQEWQRYIITGVHNKKNYEKVPYEYLKDCNYKPLVHEYYKEK